MGKEKARFQDKGGRFSLIDRQGKMREVYGLLGKRFIPSGVLVNMRPFRHSSLKNSRSSLKKICYQFSKRAVCVALVGFFPLSAIGAPIEPLLVINPFVHLEAWCKMLEIKAIEKPALILNPYVEPLKSGLNSPYRQSIPAPQIVFPAKQTGDGSVSTARAIKSGSAKNRKST